MIDKFYVCAGWIEGAPVIGECFIERVREDEIISFQYDRDWLISNPVILDPAITLRPGRQYPPKNKVFGFLEDISPDRWGRKLLDRQEMRDAALTGRKSRSLMASDYFLGVSDYGRTGGIRLMTSDGVFMNSYADVNIPPITELRKLEHAVHSVENNDKDSDKFLKDLIDPGSSLGGARPKANIIDTDGSLWIAKFPSKYDDYDVGAWEMTVHDLAFMCGIDVPPAKLIPLSNRGSTFLIRRFDRRDDGKRIHYASAMTMLGEYDDSENRSGYLDIVSVLSRISCHFMEDSRKLYERMVFNICVGNTDDHLRNHGFVLTDKGWRLSEAFDLNPSRYGTDMSLLVNFDDSNKSLTNALDVCGYFNYEEDDARKYIESVQHIIRNNMSSIASTYGLKRADVDYMSDAFSESYIQL
ncbi:MAG: type II toxin-antitoxin system HipA family toxin [Clostridiales bacterium]|nr:type II toxin-antitoxin system HipA family toxin [Clostridiales bacterium]